MFHLSSMYIMLKTGHLNKFYIQRLSRRIDAEAHMLKIGLTGGIASGKSTVLDF